MINLGTFIPDNVLTKLRDQKWFEIFVIAYCYSEAMSAGMSVRISKANLIDAHRRWLASIREMEEREGVAPDHFKQAASLVFWLQDSKIITSVGKLDSYPAAGSRADAETIRQFQECIFTYPNEYLAFSLGFQIAALHVVTPNLPFEAFAPDREYLLHICDALSEKAVPVEALSLVLKSIFFRPA